MPWQNQLRGDSVSWLLNSDSANVRYLAMRDLLDLPSDDKKLKAARKSAHREGEIAGVLDCMEEEGYWVKPGAGYQPIYRSTVWSVVLLAELGASVTEDHRVGQACKYLLDHALCDGGQFSMTSNGAPSGTVDCLQGQLIWALLELGYDDPRLDSAYEWMARTTTGEGVAPMKDKHAPVRYFAGKCGPNFACGANNKLPCAWGGVKVMLAFSRLPVEKRSELIEGAIGAGVNFFFMVDPSTADYPNGMTVKPSGNWWKFGFPVFYVTDILQIAEALVALGFAKDKRLTNTLELIHTKQDEEGRWPLEYNYDGKTWMRFGKMKEPNPWVTLRALRVLKEAG